MTNILTSRTPSKVTSIISLIALFIFMPLLLYGAKEVATIITRATGKPANIIVDTKETLEPIQTDFYHAFAQGGEGGGDMFDAIGPDLKALKPQYIRLDHLYDHYGLEISSNGDVSNWTNLDHIVDRVLAAGAKPVLALSYMPASIAKDGVIINPPNDWNAWANVVQKTVEHFSGKNNRNISGIYYEVWNEPDLGIFGSWKRSGEKNYLTLYRYAAQGANQAQNVNAFYLGGPSTTGLYQAWILDLLKSGNRIDFLSWHTYQRDPERFDQDQRNLSKWLLPYPRASLLPKLITEAGFTGDKSTGYGTMYSAAHTAAMVRQLLSNGVDYVFPFEPIDGPGQQSGNGWGFITNADNGLKKKPRYYVFNFLDAMEGDRLLVDGEGTWVTGYASTNDDGIIRLLLVNFDTNGTHTESVPVKFTNLDLGTYKTRQKFFLGSDATFTDTVTDGTITKKVLMPASSIILFELIKQ